MDPSTVNTIQNLAYLVASILFIKGLKGLTHPRTAVRGNLMGSLAMLIAIVATLWGGNIVSWTWIFAGLILGTGAGAYLATTVPMTGMPQMVGLFNGFGGAASFMVAGAELLRSMGHGKPVEGIVQEAAGAVQAAVPALQTAAPTLQASSQVGLQFLIAVALSGVIGSVTLTGSFVAAAKLKELSFTLGGKKYWMSNSILLPGRHLINAALFLLCVALCVGVAQHPDAIIWYVAVVAVAGVLGITITLPIGGADMPVVIALLNSYSGLAACSTGFVINNTVLIIAGALVGASGLILTSIMCKAMNRSLVNVIFATLGAKADGPSADDVYEGKIKSTSADEVAMLFDDAQRVVIVPGYGMAVSQAQHTVRDLANLLESKGVNVEYAIHPVAGRMPGHMNVLLAEADVPYDKLREMDDINAELEQIDVALVIGANDVVNPVARTDPNSPIAGMPIIDVDKCRTVVVIKRSLSPGFAGIPNPLFAMDHTLMFFSDGKKAFAELITAVKEG